LIDQYHHIRTPFPMSAATPESPPANAYQQLTKAINDQLALIYHTQITLLQFPSQGNFFWYYENINQIFNEGTYDYISARVGPGDEPGLARLYDPGSYPNAYAELLSQIEFQLSAAAGPATNQEVLTPTFNGESVLGSIQTATSEPTQSNGGILTIDPKTGAVSSTYKVGYSIPTPLATIATTLGAGEPTLRVHLAADQGTTATISYPGYQMVAIQPKAWQQDTAIGWYTSDLLAQALQNCSQEANGYRFTSPPYYNLGPLKSGGNFGRLVSLLISQNPIVEFSPIQSKAFDRCVSTEDVAQKFFDSLQLLRLDQAAPSRKLVDSSSNPTVPQLQQSAYVIGACLDFISQDEP
jgi:hypothetical protein